MSYPYALLTATAGNAKVEKPSRRTELKEMLKIHCYKEHISLQEFFGKRRRARDAAKKENKAGTSARRQGEFAKAQLLGSHFYV